MKKKNKGVGLIYVRYILPIVADLTLIILMFIPCVRYSLNSELREKMSLWQLITNTWNTARQYLFSSSSTVTEEGKLFYTTVFAALIICMLLLIIGVAVNVFTLVCAGSAYASKSNPKKDSNLKNLYLTFIPNRVVFIILRCTVLPIAFFPYLLVFFYRRLLLYMVSLNPTALIIGIGALAFLVATACVTALSKKYEMRLDMNIFSRKKASVVSDQMDNNKPKPDNSDEYRLYRMNQASKNEQTERLRKLLGFDEEDE